MASNFGMSLQSVPSEEQVTEASGSNENETIESGNDGQNGSDQEEKAKHRFSEPWEDSDLILVVEDEKFHVHRLILSMNSPVFKAMFKSQFKEAASSEIPLPEKKANEMLDFLKRIYFGYFQHNMQEPVEINIENVEHLLKLSDEYQIKHIFDPCIKFVENQPQTKENVMKLRKMAEMYNLNNVHEACDDLLKNMKLKTLSETVHLDDLDQETMRQYLEQRVERLETFLDKLYPEFMGMVECLFRLLHESDKYYVSWCTHHIKEGKLMSGLNIGSQEIRVCDSCNRMLGSVVQKTYSMRYSAFGGPQRVYIYGNSSSHHFEFLQSTIDDFYKIKHEVNTLQKR